MTATTHTIRRAVLTAALAASTLLTVSAAPAAADDPPTAVTGSAGRTSVASDAVGEGPEQPDFRSAFGYGLRHPDAAPPGANRWDCRPTAEHPRPVVLLHGSWLNAYDSFAGLAPRLAERGFCVFALNFGRAEVLTGGGLGPLLPGRYGVGRIEESAAQVRDFVDRVLAATGAEAVDIVAHSQGGTVASRYLKFEGGRAKVRTVVSYGATFHGTSLLGLATLGRAINDLGIDILGFYRIFIGPANIQQTVGSPFYAELNADGDTVPGVAYTAIGTRYDQVTNPYEWAFLRAGAGATVHNVTVQDGCEQDLSDHLSMLYSPRVQSLTLRALDPSAPEPVCAANAWLIGGAR